MPSYEGDAKRCNISDTDTILTEIVDVTPLTISQLQISLLEYTAKSIWWCFNTITGAVNCLSLRDRLPLANQYQAALLSTDSFSSSHSPGAAVSRLKIYSIIRYKYNHTL